MGKHEDDADGHKPGVDPKKIVIPPDTGGKRSSGGNQGGKGK